MTPLKILINKLVKSLVFGPIFLACNEYIKRVTTNVLAPFAVWSAGLDYINYTPLVLEEDQEVDHRQVIYQLHEMVAGPREEI